jgi:hypothetical protein
LGTPPADTTVNSSARTAGQRLGPQMIELTSLRVRHVSTSGPLGELGHLAEDPWRPRLSRKRVCRRGARQHLARRQPIS